MGKPQDKKKYFRYKCLQKKIQIILVSQDKNLIKNEHAVLEETSQKKIYN